MADTQGPWTDFQQPGGKSQGPWNAFTSGPWEAFRKPSEQPVTPTAPQQPPQPPGQQSYWQGVANDLAQGVTGTAGSVMRGIATQAQSQGAPHLTALSQEIWNAREDPAKLDALQKSLRQDKQLGPDQWMLADIAIRQAKAGKLLEAPHLTFGGPSLEQSPLQKGAKAVEQFGQKQFPVSPENQQNLGPQIANAIGSTLAFLPAGALGQLALTLTAGLSGAGQSQQQAEQGGATEEQQLRAAVEGVAPGLLDALPVENLLRPIQILPKKARTVLGNLFMHAFQQAVIEGGTEGAQQFLQNVIAWQVYNPDQPLTEGVFQNALVGAAAGGIMGGPAGLIHGTGHETGSATPGEAAPVRTVPPVRTEPPTEHPPLRVPVPLPGEPGPTVEGAPAAPNPKPAPEPAPAPQPKPALPTPAEPAPTPPTIGAIPGTEAGPAAPPLISLSPDQIQQWIEQSPQAELTAVTNALGDAQKAKRYLRLLNLTEHPNSEVANRAQTNLDKEFTAEQQNAAEAALQNTGIPYDVETLRAMRMAHSDVADMAGATATELYDQIAHQMLRANAEGIRAVTEGRSNNLTNTIATMVTRSAVDELRSRGMGNEKISSELLKALQRRGLDQMDAEFIAQTFTGVQRGKAEAKPVARPAIEGPQTATAPLVDPNEPGRTLTNEYHKWIMTGETPTVLNYIAQNPTTGVQDVANASGIPADKLSAALEAAGPVRKAKDGNTTIYVPDGQTGPVRIGLTSVVSAQLAANMRGVSFRAYKIPTSRLQFGSMALLKPEELQRLAPQEGPTGNAKQALDAAKGLSQMQTPAELPSWAAKAVRKNNVPFSYGDITHSETFRRLKDAKFTGADGQAIAIDQLQPGQTYIADTSDPNLQQTWEPIRKLVSLWNSKFLGHSSIALEIGTDLGDANAAATRVTDNVYAIKLSHDILTGPKDELFQVLAHEFGHTIHFEHYGNAPVHVKEALRNAYNEWLQHMYEADPSVMSAMYGGMGEQRLGHGETLAEWIDRHQRGGYSANISYFLGFHEWFAQQVSLYMQQDEAALADHSATVRDFFKGLVARLKEFFTGAYAKIRPSLGVQAMMKYSAATSQVFRENASIKPYADNRRAEGINVELPDDPLGSLVEEQLTTPFEQSKLPPELARSVPRFNKFTELAFTLTQIAKKYPSIAALQRYVQLTQDLWSEKMRVASDAEKVLVSWRKLGKDQGNRLSKFVYDVTLKSLDVGRRLTNVELADIAKANGLDSNGKAFAVFQQIDQSFQSVLADLEKGLVQTAKRTFTNPTLLNEELTRIKNDFTKLRDQHYFPLTRFGQYAVKVTAKANVTWGGNTFKPGQIMMFETYEREAGQLDRAAALLKSMGPDVEVKTDYMSNEGFAFQGFPPSLLDAMKRDMALFPHQVAELERIMVQLSPGQSFKRHMLARRGIAGFNEDAMRAYSSYMMHASGHVARLLYKDDLFKATQDVGSTPGLGPNTARQLREYLVQHYNYLNNPGNEWAGLRAGFFTLFLGFNPKSAFVNLTQVPMLAYPHLAGKHGDARAVGSLVKAMKDIANLYRKGAGALTPGEYAALERGRTSGPLRESLAGELAAAAEAGNLNRMAGGSEVGRLMRKIGYWGSRMFQVAESLNRDVTFLAAYRLNGGDYAQAIDSVQTSMFEYARWNRPAIMRGKKSVMFLFMNYMQQALWFLSHDKGAMRALFMLTAMAGLQGLPFADDMLDIYDGFKTWISRLTGWGDPSVDVRKQIRDLVAETGANPDLVMHGLSRYTAGLFDISGSLSMGRVIPGARPLTQALQRGTMDPNQLLAESGTEVGGAAAQYFFNVLRAVASNTPDTVQRFQGILPSEVRNLVEAYRYAAEGKAKNSLGDTLVQFDPHDPWQLAEIIGQAAGFRPTRLAATQERIAAQRDAAQFYTIRKQILLTQYFWARSTNDREALADVTDAIKRYNKAAPFPELRLTYKNLRSSYRSRLKGQLRRELDLGTSRQTQRLYGSYSQGFPVPGNAQPSVGVGTSVR